MLNKIGQQLFPSARFVLRRFNFEIWISYIAFCLIIPSSVPHFELYSYFLSRSSTVMLQRGRLQMFTGNFKMKTLITLIFPWKTMRKLKLFRTTCEHCFSNTTWLISVTYACDVWAWIAQSVLKLATGRTVRGSNPGGGKFFRTLPDQTWDPPSLLYNGYRVFPGGKGAGAGRWPPSSARVKERVGLYLYSPSGPLGPVLRRTVCMGCAQIKQNL